MTIAPPKTTVAGALAARARRLVPEPLRRRLPPWQRARPWLTLASGVLAVVASTAAVWGLNILLDIGGHPTREVRGLSGYEESQFAMGPRNVLLLGSDTRAGLTPEEQVQFGLEEGERSDTIILLHLDPRRETAVVVHFPRDLRVEIPGHGMDKINAAYEFGGPTLVVRTVKAFSGLPIHNYIEVDLAGFQDLIDALGGVRMCVDRPMYDELAGLAIPKAGCYLFDGQRALAFVRARHIEGDIVPDFSRIARQQQFMRAMMNRLLSIGSLVDTEVIERAAQNVTTDQRLTAADLVFLGSKLRELAEEDPSGARSLDFRVVPGTPQTLPDGVSYVIAEEQEAQRLFQALRAGRPLGKVGLTLANTLPSPGVTKVRVLSAGLTIDVEGAEGLLRRAGFIVLETEAAGGGLDQSAILFKPNAGGKAQVVGGYFPGLPREEGSPTILGGADVAVVVGEEFRTVLEEDAE